MKKLMTTIIAGLALAFSAFAEDAVPYGPIL
jgi:hypothetical protein